MTEWKLVQVLHKHYWYVLPPIPPCLSPSHPLHWSIIHASSIYISQDPKRPGFLQCYDPSTSQRLGEVPIMTAKDVSPIIHLPTYLAIYSWYTYTFTMVTMDWLFSLIVIVIILRRWMRLPLEQKPHKGNGPKLLVVKDVVCWVPCWVILLNIWKIVPESVPAILANQVCR